MSRPTLLLFDIDGTLVTTPGVGRRALDRVLAALDGRAGVAIGLGTGNVRPGAAAKLGRVGILRHFAFGGFGCDHEDRAELLRVGVVRGAATLGVAAGSCRVVVVGDTPRDVAAATEIGAESIGVATCGFGTADLLASGATRAFDDMTAAGFVDVLVGG